VGEGEGFLQRGEVARVGCGDGAISLAVRARQDSGGGGLAADDGGVDAFAGEGVDEAGGVADEEDAAVGDVSVASERLVLGPALIPPVRQKRVRMGHPNFWRGEGRRCLCRC